jgi:hypothetical protein
VFNNKDKELDCALCLIKRFKLRWFTQPYYSATETKTETMITTSFIMVILATLSLIHLQTTAQDPAIPSECLKPVGYDCSFYKRCLEYYHECIIVEQIAAPKCEEYKQIEEQFSSKGKEWSEKVRSCLQLQTARHILARYGSNFTCHNIESKFFSDHVPCYIKTNVPTLPFGFCSLDMSDKALVIKHGYTVLFSKNIYQVTYVGMVLWYCVILGKLFTFVGGSVS